MKELIVSLLLVSPLLAVAQDTAASVSGKWKVHSSVGGNESDAVCTFVHKNSDLSGSCVSEQGTMAITGKVEGKKVSWSYKSDYNGTALTVKYIGTANADKITGDTTVDPFGISGDFSAVKAN